MPDSELQPEAGAGENNSQHKSQPADDHSDSDPTIDVNEYRLNELPDPVGYRIVGESEVAPVPFTSPGRGEFIPVSELDVAGQLRESVQLAETALAEVTDAELVGELIGAVDEGEGVYSLCFASLGDGYRDWRWNVTLCKVVDAASDTAAPSVLECELVPGPDSLVAPKWIPWAERLAEFNATHDSHGNPIEAGEGKSEPAPTRTRTSSRTRTRRRLRRDRTTSAAATGENKSPAASAEDDELPVADDIREFAEERDQQLDGINFESEDDE